MEPRSETIESGMPWRRITWCKNILANSGAEVVLLQGARWHILVSLSMTTNKESYPLEMGKSVTKSQDMPFHGLEGTGSGASSPCLRWRGDLPREHRSNCVAAIQGSWPLHNGQLGDRRDASASARRVTHRHAERKQGCHVGGVRRPAMTMAWEGYRDILGLGGPSQGP